MKELQQLIGIFYVTISINKTYFNIVILFYIKFGTKHVTWEHGHFYEVASY